MDLFVCVVPVYVHSEVTGSCPVMRAFVVVPKDAGEVVDMFATHIFYVKIIDTEGEGNWAKIVMP